MFRIMTALLTAFTLIHSSNLAVATPASSQGTPAKPSALKEQLIGMPAGSTVEVKLANKQKLKGRLGQLSDDGFEVQTVKDGKVSVEKVAFSEVKSVKQKGKPMSTGTKTVL